MNSKIPFNKAHIAGKELYYIAQAVSRGELRGDGPFTKLCSEWIERRLGVEKVLITHSCTAALEMAAIVLDIQPGDEVILPSYTFTSTANAFLLRGATLRFVDVRPDTLNIDENLIEAAISPKTKAICVVHYSGVGCEMDTIVEIAQRKGVPLVEDAAHAILATYKGRPLGTIGHVGTFSFHETKNYSSGEGGAILLNDRALIERAEIIREKGTNRSKFFRGEVDRYSWVDIGSSYLPSEIISAFLYGQLEHADAINDKRCALWRYYFDALQPLAEEGLVQLPHVPPECEMNGHMFYLLTNTAQQREELLRHLSAHGVSGVIHYVPLHTSPQGRRLGYKSGDLPVTEDIAQRIVRLPLYCDLTFEEAKKVMSVTAGFFQQGDKLVGLLAG